MKEFTALKYFPIMFDPGAISLPGVLDDEMFFSFFLYLFSLILSGFYRFLAGLPVTPFFHY